MLHQPPGVTVLVAAGHDHLSREVACLPEDACRFAAGVREALVAIVGAEGAKAFPCREPLISWQRLLPLQRELSNERRASRS